MTTEASHWVCLPFRQLGGGGGGGGGGTGGVNKLLNNVFTMIPAFFKTVSKCPDEEIEPYFVKIGSS
jgi:hypothetical protein